MGWTLQQIRQFGAREAGKFHVSTCTSGTTVNQVEDLTWPVASQVRPQHSGRPFVVATIAR